jgi:hypothetical protein
MQEFHKAITTPLFFKIFITDQPISPNNIVVEYADDKAIFSIHKNPFTTPENLQSHFFELESWYKNWLKLTKLNHGI